MTVLPTKSEIRREGELLAEGNGQAWKLNNRNRCQDLGVKAAKTDCSCCL